MTNYLGKSCSFCLPRVPFVSCRRSVCLVISLFGFEGRIGDLIVSAPDHCLSFYFAVLKQNLIITANKCCKFSNKIKLHPTELAKQSVRFNYLLKLGIVRLPVGATSFKLNAIELRKESPAKSKSILSVNYSMCYQYVWYFI